jgi:hypothetical protein
MIYFKLQSSFCNITQTCEYNLSVKALEMAGANLKKQVCTLADKNQVMYGKALTSDTGCNC